MGVMLNVLAFIAIAAVIIALVQHFAPKTVAAVEAKATAALPKSVQTIALDAAVAASNAAEKATAEAMKVDLAIMRKWFSAAAAPHIDALDAENEVYRTEVKA